MLRVAGIGLSSSLGGLVGACAAFRAGLVHVGAAPGLEAMEPGDEGPSPIVVHAHPGAQSGFSGVGRLVVLLAGALEDLALRMNVARLGPRVAIFLALPAPDDRMDAGIFPDGADSEEELVSRTATVIVDRAFRAAGLGAPGAPVRAIAAAEVGFAFALAEAARALEAGAIDGALVACVDSFADPAVLEAELEEETVKTEHNPSGYMPGEAAVVCGLARGERAGMALGVPALARSSARPGDGAALARVALEALAQIPHGPQVPTLVSDHDGTPVRAQELGMSKVRLAGRDRGLGEAPVLFPALGFGRTGAASGGLALAVASQALERGYARAPAFLVLSSSEAGDRAALAVTREGLD